jgi:hypothetical protein
MKKTTYPKISFYDFWHIINDSNPPEQGLIYLENLIAEGNSDYFEEGSEDHPDSEKVSDFLRSGKLYDYLKEKLKGNFGISVYVGYILIFPDSGNKYYYIGKEPILASPEFRNRLLAI